MEAERTERAVWYGWTVRFFSGLSYSGITIHDEEETIYTEIRESIYICCASFENVRFLTSFASENGVGKEKIF